ncbi:thiH [Wigglesworthia glossinidia endosymbiont of Glossina brevipalpis]|uniref:ThiH protein n=1 Tax=Wigglesworthia glossinidia brevipalpis TaxID=36870 RepID=Q8D250_WIGBR|nr:thiH [Wigglesworthia glossinidia endosymbiont of Glossina brevipalpis]
MKTFKQYWEKIKWNEVSKLISKCKFRDVENILNKNFLLLNDAIPLLSKAASFYLESLAQKAKIITRTRFGNNINLFMPLYLSNFCSNDCTYCGFSMKNKIKRKVLNEKEILRECEVILKQNIKNILLVSGEHNKISGIDYLYKIISLIRKKFSSIAIEVQPLSTEEYKLLKKVGLDGVLVYQETYNIKSYKEHHIIGKKRDFFWRLSTPERIAKSNIEKIGLGILIGLSENWRTDCYFLMNHIFYLRKFFWKTNYSLSILRLRPCTNGISPKCIINESDLLQIMCVFRILFPEIEISLSTRESKKFRDNISPILINNISAGSSTQPGGYSTSKKELNQFEIQDNRSPREVSQELEKKGMNPVWKDWDYYLGRY